MAVAKNSSPVPPFSPPLVISHNIKCLTGVSICLYSVFLLYGCGNTHGGSLTCFVLADTVREQMRAACFKWQPCATENRCLALS